MSDIGMVSEFRTDFDCEVIGLPSEMWAECKIQIEDSDDFHFEIIAEKNLVIHLIIGDVQWKGTLKGLKDLLQSKKMMFIHFRNKRDWAQFQSTKNLALSNSIEDTEILERFQWTTEDKDIPLDKREAMAEEKADILIYLLFFANALDIDPIQAAHDKMARNAEKYAADLGRGKSDTYTEY